MGKGFENGHMKMGGREKGTRNKNTEIKNFFRDFVIDNQEEFKKAFLKLKDKDKCAVYLKASGCVSIRYPISLFIPIFITGRYLQ